MVHVLVYTAVGIPSLSESVPLLLHLFSYFDDISQAILLITWD